MQHTNIHNNQVLLLSENDAKKFVEFMQKPPKPSSALVALLTNIVEVDNDSWDAQIEADFLSGKFDQLIKEASKEFAQKAVEI